MVCLIRREKTSPVDKRGAASAEETLAAIATDDSVFSLVLFSHVDCHDVERTA